MDFTMDSIGSFLSNVFPETSIILPETWVDDNFVLLTLALFIFELIRYAFKKKLSWNMGEQRDQLCHSVLLVGDRFLGRLSLCRRVRLAPTKILV